MSEGGVGMGKLSVPPMLMEKIIPVYLYSRSRNVTSKRSQAIDATGPDVFHNGGVRSEFSVSSKFYEFLNAEQTIETFCSRG